MLWEVTLEGRPQDDGHLAWGAYAKKHVSELERAHGDADTMFLSVVTSVELAEGNAYGQRPGPATLVNWFDLRTGHRAVVVVRVDSAERLARAYDPATGRVTWERVSTFHETGGRAVGAASDRWVRVVVRTFDPRNGARLTEETFRIDGSTPVRIKEPG